jgi:hypothetical protein
MQMRVQRIKHCVGCPHFSYGQNDPYCYHPDKPDGLYPNCGTHAEDPPPRGCPLRKKPEVIHITRKVV